MVGVNEVPVTVQYPAGISLQLETQIQDLIAAIGKTWQQLSTEANSVGQLQSKIDGTIAQILAQGMSGQAIQGLDTWWEKARQDPTNGQTLTNGGEDSLASVQQELSTAGIAQGIQTIKEIQSLNSSMVPAAQLADMQTNITAMEIAMQHINTLLSNAAKKLNEVTAEISTTHCASGLTPGQTTSVAPLTIPVPTSPNNTTANQTPLVTPTTNQTVPLTPKTSSATNPGAMPLGLTTNSSTGQTPLSSQAIPAAGLMAGAGIASGTGTGTTTDPGTGTTTSTGTGTTTDPGTGTTTSTGTTTDPGTGTTTSTGTGTTTDPGTGTTTSTGTTTDPGTGTTTSTGTTTDPGTGTPTTSTGTTTSTNTSPQQSPLISLNPQTIPAIGIVAGAGVVIGAGVVAALAIRNSTSTDADATGITPLDIAPFIPADASPDPNHKKKHAQSKRVRKLNIALAQLNDQQQPKADASENGELEEQQANLAASPA